MISKTVKYVDFKGNKREKELLFNLTQTELVELASELPDDVLKMAGDESTKVDESSAANIIKILGGNGILEFIKKLVLKSYGVVSEDGDRFIKTEELSTEFSQTLAYDKIIMEFMSDDAAAAAFVNGIIPANMANKTTVDSTTPVLPINN